MTKAEECKAKIEALRWALTRITHFTQNGCCCNGWRGVVEASEVEADVEREIQSLKARSMAERVPS